MKACCFLLFIVFSINTTAQNSIVDSLKSVLQTAKEDTNKVKTLYLLSDECSEEEILDYAIPALELAEKLNFKKGIADASSNISYVHFNHGDFTKALQYINKALKIYQAINDKEGVASSLSSLGSNYGQRGDIYQALEYYTMALKIKKEIGDKKAIAHTLLSIGEMYDMQGDIPHAMEYWQESLKLSEESGYKYGIACSLFSIGYCYEIQKQYGKEMEFIQKGLKIQREIGDKQGIANSLNSIGKYYFNQSMFTEALQNYNEALKIAEEIDDPNGKAVYLNNIGSIYLKQRKFKQAELYFKHSLQIAKAIGLPKRISDASANLGKLYSLVGRYREAYQMHVLYKQMSDSVINIEIKQSSLKKRMEYEFEKKEAVAKVIQAKKDAEIAAEIKNQKLIRNFSITGAITLVSFGSYSFYRYRRRRKLQSEQEMLNERLRISRELHDDIGSTLGSISIYSEVAKSRIQKNENADESLSKIGTASRELIDKMSDIVWSMNPNNESINQLQNRMQVFAAIMLTPRNILYNFYTQEHLKEIKLTTAERKNIYLIYKEAIHNIAKYADCTQVEIQLTAKDHLFAMHIKDNGKGFELTKLEQTGSLNGNGIKNMMARAESIGAVLKIESKIKEGTEIMLRVELSS